MVIFPALEIIMKTLESPYQPIYSGKYTFYKCTFTYVLQFCVRVYILYNLTIYLYRYFLY